MLAIDCGHSGARGLQQGLQMALQFVQQGQQLGTVGGVQARGGLFGQSPARRHQPKVQLLGLRRQLQPGDAPVVGIGRRQQQATLAQAGDQPRQLALVAPTVLGQITLRGARMAGKEASTRPSIGVGACG